MAKQATIKTPQKGQTKSFPHFQHTPQSSLLNEYQQYSDEGNRRQHGSHVTSDVRRARSGAAATTPATPGQPHRYRLRARRDSTPSRRSSSRRDRSNRKTRHAVEDDSPEPASKHHRRHNSLEQGAIVIEGVRTLNFFAVREKLFNCSGRSLKRTNTTASNTTTTTTTAMASAGGKWREEQILIICPGSRTTMAQLGCSELTPPTHRFPTRMFKDGDEWRPYYTYQRKRVVDGVEKEEWVEDVDEDEGATWPIQGGQIVNMDAFLAFLDHVHSMLTTTYHNTPIMLMASPQWTRPDCEAIAQYIFEKTRTPALCMINSAIATQYGLKFPNMTVVDIGYEKVDVTAIYDGRVVNHLDLGPPRFDDQISGGEVFTRKLMKLLEGKNFNRDMAEQLKRSPICEVLPYAPNAKSLVDLPKETGVAQPVAEPEKLVEVPESNEAPKPPQLQTLQKPRMGNRMETTMVCWMWRA
ncbi:hypothetical protein V2G26_006690 [Clonostachys chloroleuca]